MENLLLINNPDIFIKNFDEILSTNKNKIKVSSTNENETLDNVHNFIKDIVNYIKTLSTNEREVICYNLSLNDVQQIINDSYKNLINENNSVKNEFNTDIKGTVTLVGTEKNFLSKIKDVIPKIYNDFYSYMCTLSIKGKQLIYDPDLFITSLEAISEHIDNDSLKQSLNIIIYIIKFIVISIRNTNIK